MSGSGHLRLDSLKGERNEDIEQFLKRFDQYVACLNLRGSQALAVLSWHLDGMARLYVNSQGNQPLTVEELKQMLLARFRQERPVSSSVLQLQQQPKECVEDFLCRLEKDCIKFKIGDVFQVQIALQGLHPTISSAISTHAPGTLQDVRTLAHRIINTQTVVTVTANQQCFRKFCVLTAAVSQLKTVIAGLGHIPERSTS